MASTLRLFIAVELPEDVLGYIGETVGDLRRQGITGIRWVRGEGVHLTLKFLGDTSEEQVAGILSSMRDSAVGTPPFVLHVQGAGAFPNMRAPRVLWLGVQGDTAPLLQIHGRLEEALEAQGFAREARAFSAHLTLGRVNGRLSPTTLERLAQDMEGLRTAKPLALPVAALSLMESQLTPPGAYYGCVGQALLSP
ncbi:MAG: RNA 2',3'-cyclic phosphodiesterase [Dehalococcoidia bacterium]|nr:RNA 2',3'-cyclic phosphodiesterase [Dehalococcoidia bacterium]